MTPVHERTRPALLFTTAGFGAFVAALKAGRFGEV